MKLTKGKDSKTLKAVIARRDLLIEETANATQLDQIAINVDALKRIDIDISYLTSINDELTAAEIEVKEQK